MDVEVFLLEEEEALGGAPNAAPADQVLMQAHIAYLLRAPSAQTAKVVHDVKVCCLRLNLLTGRELCSAGELAAALAACGHSVSVLKSAGGGAGVAAFRNLRHTFLSIAPQAAQPLPLQPVQPPSADWQSSWEEEGQAEDGPTSEGQTIIVDPHFRCQFVLAAPSPRYAALQRLLPQTFVGTREQLEQVVEWASREMAWSFKEAMLALPPWREQGAMLSKWRVAGSAPGSCSPCTSPRAAPAASCCCCCQGQDRVGPAGPKLHAHDVAAVAAELAAGQRSPCSVVAGDAPLPYFGSSADCQDLASRSSSTPLTPTHCLGSAAAAARVPTRVSLLSQSLEAAGMPARLQRAASGVAPRHHWWEARTGHEQPRTITVVRRSAP